MATQSSILASKIPWTEDPGQFSSVQSLSCLCLILCSPMDCSIPGLPVHHQLTGACSNSCPSSPWYHPTISSSVIPFSSCLQYFPASGSYQMSQFFPSDGQSIGTSASASVLLIDFLEDWLVGSLKVQGTLKSFLQHHSSKASILRHSAFFIVQLSHPHMSTGKTIALTIYWPLLIK